MEKLILGVLVSLARGKLGRISGVRASDEALVALSIIQRVVALSKELIAHVSASARKPQVVPPTSREPQPTQNHQSPTRKN